MIDEKELKDSVKECVDIAMEQNDEAKREIFAGLFEEVDRLINETITMQAINDDEKKKWFDNEMIKTYEQEIKELQEENKMQDHELERLRNIINDKKERQDIAIRLLHKLFGTNDYEINYIIGIINGQRQIKFDDEILDGSDE